MAKLKQLANVQVEREGKKRSIPANKLAFFQKKGWKKVDEPKTALKGVKELPGAKGVKELPGGQEENGQ